MLYPVVNTAFASDRQPVSLLTAIADALKRGDEVRLPGFGTFTVATRAAGQARNPRTGEPVTVAASRQPKFKAGKALKDALN